MLPARSASGDNRRAAVTRLHRHLAVHGHLLPGRAGAAAQRQLSPEAGVLNPLQHAGRGGLQCADEFVLPAGLLDFQPLHLLSARPRTAAEWDVWLRGQRPDTARRHLCAVRNRCHHYSRAMCILPRRADRDIAELLLYARPSDEHRLLLPLGLSSSGRVLYAGNSSEPSPRRLPSRHDAARRRHLQDDPAGHNAGEPGAHNTAACAAIAACPVAAVRRRRNNAA